MPANLVRGRMENFSELRIFPFRLLRDLRLNTAAARVKMEGEAIDMQKILPIEEIESLKLEPAMAEHIRAGKLGYFESFEHHSLMAFAWDDPRGKRGKGAEVVVCLGREDLAVFCRDSEVARLVRDRMPRGQSNERALYGLFVEMLRDDMEGLDELEKHITDAEDAALKSSHSVYLGKIVRYRKLLLHLKRYYARLDAIFDNLAANANGLLSPEGERLFSALMNRNHRLLDAAINLRDYVTQMREAYQAQIDIEQNSLMKVFTVVTAISTPVTVITGWYGMNFARMPELEWAWSYPAVALISAGVALGLAVLFRRRHWL